MQRGTSRASTTDDPRTTPRRSPQRTPTPRPAIRPLQLRIFRDRLSSRVWTASSSALVVTRERSVRFGKVLAEQPVGVLVGGSLPGLAGSAMNTPSVKCGAIRACWAISGLTHSDGGYPLRRLTQSTSLSVAALRHVDPNGKHALFCRGAVFCHRLPRRSR